MTNEELRIAAERFGTPCFIFDEAVLAERVAEIRGIFGGKIHLCYSIKANPFLTSVMSSLTDRLEVCSPGEMNICERLGIDGEKIIYSGVNKTPENIAAAFNAGAGIFTAESLLHVRELNELGCEQGKVLPVLLRLNAGSQFGMSREDALSVIAEREKYSGITLEGIHYFAGTQRRKLSEKQKELEMLREFFDEVEREYGLRLRRLEYGPGLPVPYFEGDDFSDTLAPAREIADELRKAAEWADVTVEMGRFFVSECGFYLTRIMDQKSNLGTNYCIIDGGINHLNYFGQIMGMKIPVMRHLKAEGNGETAAEDWCLCGSLCTTGDVLVRKVSIEGLRIGDVLAFENIGAYSVCEGIYMFLSRMMPKIILRHGDGSLEQVREAFDTSLLNTVNIYNN